MEESMIKVSVIIPVYNVEEYIEECLVSVLNQTIKDIEIICVDDGSSDASVDIIQKYATDKRIIVFQKENGGQASARNIGVTMASGEYIYFLDSDDYLVPNAMELLYEEAVKYNLDNVYFDAESFFESEELKKKHSNFIDYYIRNNDYSEVVTGLKLLQQMDENNEFRVSPCLQFLKKSFLDKYDLHFEEGFIHEDELYSLEIALCAKRTKHIREVLYLRRVRESSTMTGNTLYKHSLGYFQCILYLLKKIDSYEINATYRNIIMKRIYGLQSSGFRKTMYISNVELDEYLLNLSINEEAIYRLILKRSADDLRKINRLNVENKKLKKRIKELEQSHSYRIGRIITWLPGKIKLLLKTIRTTGWKYLFSTIYRKLNKNKVCVSIIMPVYNTASYLEECLTSLAKQSLYNIEVICVNDGSTDESLNILQEFAKQDKRFHIINKENTGAGDSRNVGMKQAKGEYLLFLDSDDLFHKDLCYQVYRRAKIDNADICFTGAERINMKTNQKEYMGWVLRTALLPPNTPFQKETMEDKYFQMCSGCPWSKLFRRSFVQEHQLEFQNLKNSNDVYFVRTAMALADRLTYVDKRLITYRFAEGDNTQSNKHKNPLEFYKAYKALKEKLVDENIYSQLEKTFVNMVFDDCMFNYRTTDTEEAKGKIRDKLLEEGIAFFEFSKYPDSYFENKNNVKDFRTVFNTQTT